MTDEPLPVDEFGIGFGGTTGAARTVFETRGFGDRGGAGFVDGWAIPLP